MKKLIILSLLLVVLPIAAYSKEQKIISICGAVTEIIYALGGESQIIATDTTSYYPEAANKFPKVGYMRTLSAEGILSLKPDVIIATNEAGPKPVLEQISKAGIKIHQVDLGNDLSSLKKEISDIAEILGKQDQAKKLNSELDEKLKTFKAYYAGKFSNKKILVVMAHNPSAIMSVGNNTAANEVIKLIGAKNIAEEIDGYKPINLEFLSANKPDLIVVAEKEGDNKKYPDLEKITKNIISIDSMTILSNSLRNIDAARKIAEKL